MTTGAAAPRPAPPASLAFGRFRLDEANALLLADGQALELPPKAFAVLCRLAMRPGALVTKDELLDAVWGHRFVSESVLKTAVNTIRGALGDDPAQPRFIETVRGRGYRFVAAPVTAPRATATVGRATLPDPDPDSDPSSAATSGPAPATAPATTTATASPGPRPTSTRPPATPRPP